MAHKHYPGFSLDENTLQNHLSLDHEVDEAQFAEISDVIEWHTAQHAEITETGQPTIQELANQITQLTAAVDQLVFDNLMGT